MCLEGRPGMSDVSLLSGISGLSLDSSLLSLVLLPTPIALSILSFFLPIGHSPDFFLQKILRYFSLRDSLFGMALI